MPKKIRIVADAEFNFEVLNSGLSAAEEAHALWTIQNYAAKRLRELAQQMSGKTIEEVAKMVPPVEKYPEAEVGDKVVTLITKMTA